MKSLKECKKEFKKLLKNANKIYKTKPYKFKENQLNNLIEACVKSITVITSNEKAFEVLHSKFNKYNSLSSYYLLENEDYFNEYLKIFNAENFDYDNNILSKSLIDLLYYRLSYKSILYPHIKKFIDANLIDNNEITDLQQKLANAFNYWEFSYNYDIENNKPIDKNINIDLLNKYFNFNNEIKERNKKYQEEEKNKLRKEKAENFKKETLSLDIVIEVDEKYKLPRECNFLSCFEDFKTTYGNRIAVDKSENLGDYNDLILKIAYENNIYALTEYLLKIIVGNYKHVSILNDVIKHMLTKVKYNLRTLEFEKIGTQCSYAAFCEYLMYQFGIVFEKDVNKARYLLLKNAHLIKTPIIYKRPYFNKYILKAIFMHYKDYIHFDAYNYILNYILSDIKYSAYYGYDHEIYRYVLEYAKEKNNIDFIGRLLNELEIEGINIFEEFAQEKAIYDKKIDEERQRQEEIKQKEKEKLEEIEKKKEEEYKKRYELLHPSNSNSNLEKYKSLSIEELSNLKDDYYAMNLVASHYFDLGCIDKNNYLKAAEYFDYCSKVGNPYQYVNVGISYGNYSSKTDDEYAKLEQDCYRTKAKEYSFFAFRFILSEYKYNPIQDIEKDEIYNYYMNNKDVSEFNKSIIKIAYNLYKYDVYSAFSIYNSIKYELKNISILEKIFTFIFAILEKNNFQKFSNFDNEALKDEIELVYKLGCKRLGLLIGLAYYRGNFTEYNKDGSYIVSKDKLYDRDLKKAYNLLKENEKYGGYRKDYYQSIIEEIEKKCNHIEI